MAETASSSIQEHTWQPLTHYPLPKVAACVDFSNLATLRCPLIQENDEDERHCQYVEMHRRLVCAAKDLDNHSILLNKVLRELLPAALSREPSHYDGMCVDVPDARTYLAPHRSVEQPLKPSQSPYWHDFREFRSD